MSRLPEVRLQLLGLHRALLESERVAYERVHGRTKAGTFLGQVIGAPEFAWLQPMTALIVGIDEAIDAAKEERPEASASDVAEQEAAYLADARRLLVVDAEGNEFQRKYAAALQGAPDVVLEHGALVRLLKD